MGRHRVRADQQGRDAIGATDGSQATEDETPPENLRRISDPSTGSPAAREAIDRATAAVGKDEGE